LALNFSAAVQPFIGARRYIETEHQVAIERCFCEVRRINSDRAERERERERARGESRVSAGAVDASPAFRGISSLPSPSPSFPSTAETTNREACQRLSMAMSLPSRARAVA